MQIDNFFDNSLLRVYQQPLASSSTSSQEKNSSTKEDSLTSAQKNQIAKLEVTDRKVRQHEAAHISAGGSVIKSGATFTYQQGPDNKLYAIGGEVAIDTSEEASPKETITKMQTVRAAALAPSDPSSTDYQVAATASLLELKARLELSQELRQEQYASALEQYTNNIPSADSFSQYA
jgi:hypothetical protein